MTIATSRLMFNFIAVYQSPFGKGGTTPLSNKWAAAIAGGWEVSGVLTMHDGFPLFVTMGTGGITSRLNRIPGVSAVLPSSYQKLSNYRYNRTQKSYNCLAALPSLHRYAHL